MMKSRSPYVCVAACLLPAMSAFAQPTVGIRHAVFVPKTTDTPAHVELVLSGILETPAAVAAAQDTSKYRLVDLFSGPGRTYAPKELVVDRAVVPALPLLPPESLNTVQLFLAQDLPAAEEDRYILIVSGLAIGAKNVAVTAAPTRVTMRITAPSAVTPHWGKAKDKESADVYFAGSISRSAGKDFFGKADVKVRYPMLERTIRGRLHAFAPAFDLAASDNPDADPDSLRLGVIWQFFPIATNTGVFPLTRWENGFEQEASRNFDYRTLLWRSEFLLLPPAWRVGAKGWFWINPLIGIAAGRIFDVPADAFDDGGLFRLLGGLSATFEVPTLFARTLSLSAEYQWRQQWQDELAGAVTLGRGSHPWTSVKAEIGFTDFVSFGAVFQNGEQPPKYKDVRRSLTFDLTFKAARRNRPQ